jgi:two-component system chemotaxis sensor kinase CheA
MSDTDDIVRDFLVESSENLDQLDRDLVELEKDPTDRELLARVFRAIHTIKGTCGFLGFARLESVAHAGENLLSCLRDGQLTLNWEITSGLLAMVDAVRKMLATIESTGQDGEGDYRELIERLAGLQTASSVPGRKDAPEPAALVESEDDAPAAQATGKPSVEDRRNIGDILIERAHVAPEEVAAAAEQQQLGDPRHLGEILVERGVVKPSEVLEALQAQKEIHAPAVSDNTIRVDVGLLDKLMNLVGELVLAGNQILQHSSSRQDPTFLNAAQRLNFIAAELQEGLTKTRMQPIGSVWSRLPRVVRDLAMACGKQVRIEMEGQETELDRTLIEAIKDPLTHIVRNSVDHGIELPEDRLAAGKPAEGQVLLRAFQAGGQVNIEISDDGAGVDLERVKQKALERELLTPGQAAHISERELLALLFLPGFSTAARVTNVSGRGVGMDVVKTNIEKIGGTVDIQSKTGQGMSVKIRIPLTLAIIPALIVTSAGDRYAIPQVNFLELVRLESDQARQGVEIIHGVPVYRLRGRPLPLVYLKRELKVVTAAESSSTANIVVLRTDDRQFGLVVDEVNGTEEIAVRPLGRQLKGISCFTGATIMGDGRTALILDVRGLAQAAGVVAEEDDQAMVGGRPPRGEEVEDREALLLVSGPGGGRLAIPLPVVARLEEFECTQVQRSGSQLVVQYHDGILPLLHLSGVLPEWLREPQRSEECDADPRSGRIHVVVCTARGRSIGLVVDRILDIVNVSLEGSRVKSREGMLGSVVIQGRVNKLDVAGIIRAIDPGFSDESAAA